MLFQSRYCIAANCVTALETTIRWQTGQRRGISEAALVELTQKARVMNSYYNWVVSSGAKALLALEQPIRISLKAPAAVIETSILFRSVDHAVTELGLAPEQLEISINDAVLAALDEASLLTLAGLFDAGVSIAISHFGGDLANLRLLTRIPFDCLLLDPGLVRTLPDDRGSMAIVRGAIETAHALGVRVVAAGVETKAQYSALGDMGCDEAQGGLFSPPLPQEKVHLQAMKLISY